MSATSAVLHGRAAAEALMVDACTITAGAAVQVYDEASDTYVTPAGASRYSGPCRVKPRESDQNVEAGAESISLWPYTVSVPVAAVGIDVDDVVTVTDCPLDPSLVGRTLRVRQVTQGSFITARRLGCEVQT